VVPKSVSRWAGPAAASTTNGSQQGWFDNFENRPGSRHRPFEEAAFALNMADLLRGDPNSRIWTSDAYGIFPNKCTTNAEIQQKSNSNYSMLTETDEVWFKL
jgi:hypothetical protein